MSSSRASGSGRGGTTAAGFGAGRAGAARVLGAGRAAALGAARFAGFFAAAFLSGLDFLRIAVFPAGAFLRLTLAFGFFFAAAMALSIGCAWLQSWFHPANRAPSHPGLGAPVPTPASSLWGRGSMGAS